jgi:hypothetical protein
VMNKKRSEENRQYIRKQSAELTDSYIRALLLQSRHPVLQESDMTPEVIELKRQQVRMKRNLKKHKETENESYEHGKSGEGCYNVM